MSALDQAPDLLNGFLINCIDRDNRWQTDVQCALARRGADGNKQWAHLAAACRAEDVSPSCIFPQRFYEAAVLHSWDGAFMMRSGSALNPPFPWQRANADKRRCSPIAPGQVHCPMAAVEELSFARILAELQSPAERRDSHLFMCAEWQADGFDWELYSRCRYTNFNNPDRTNLSSYVQPISGPVLFPVNGTLKAAYLAAYVDADGTRTMEVVIRDKFSLLSSWASLAGRMSGAALKALDCLGLGRIFSGDEYASPRRVVDGCCRFYRYRAHE